MSKVSNIPRFVSIKCAITFLTESILEFEACYHLEYDDSVIIFEAQPLGYEYFYEGNKCRYTPDFLVIYRSGKKVFIEVKPARITKRPEFKDRFAAQKDAAVKQGITLVIWTDEFIREQPYLENLKTLHRYRTRDSITTEQRKILTLVPLEDQVVLHELANNPSVAASDPLPAVYDLIAKGLLTVDLHSSRLSQCSLVGINYDHYSEIY